MAPHGNLPEQARFPVGLDEDSTIGQRVTAFTSSLHAGYKFTRLSRRAFITTVKEDSAIAAPANIGDIRMPETG